MVPNKKATPQPAEMPEVSWVLCGDAGSSVQGRELGGMGVVDGQSYPGSLCRQRHPCLTLSGEARQRGESQREGPSRLNRLNPSICKRGTWP